MHTLRIVLLVALSASGTVSARLLDREALLAARQSSGQDENRIRGSCTQTSNKCNLPGRNAQVCPADYNRVRVPVHNDSDKTGLEADERGSALSTVPLAY
ncbi:uncharacterized protein LY79DRAFT_665752 [Colletotrichum navitas]|uniref:Uncharacterized protein n=1 Tax=Colletotrichum navitas TaxID=681940 RepID=A0AAD8Q9N2_9PEZI|nr:uncharacterized protein LY79DRAFT_665752 [Colletotrichum navitas]KAK1598576.1 hypothetical protein LY79DRAFT_665752 [Colletotrichum navitas]